MAVRAELRLEEGLGLVYLVRDDQPVDERHARLMVVPLLDVATLAADLLAILQEQAPDDLALILAPYRQ